VSHENSLIIDNKGFLSDTDMGSACHVDALT